MSHQKYTVKQMNVCRGYNGSRGEQKRNEKVSCRVFEYTSLILAINYSTCGPRQTPASSLMLTQVCSRTTVWSESNYTRNAE